MVNILKKIRDAKTPDRFTEDFLGTVLGFRGGNARQFIPLAKKIGLLSSDGRPTALYRQFRNPQTSGAALAEALRNGYREAFERNEYADRLSRDEFKGLVVEITGLEPNSRVVQLICQTFESLKTLADFERSLPQGVGKDDGTDTDENHQVGDRRDLDLRLSYVINLVLPKTDDPAVFNTIFRALRDNLLR